VKQKRRKAMSSKYTTRIKDIRPPKGDLDINDALRLAVEDERFAAALATDPERFKSVFKFNDAEVAAIRESIGKAADIGTAGWYE